MRQWSDPRYRHGPDPRLESGSLRGRALRVPCPLGWKGRRHVGVPQFSCRAVHEGLATKSGIAYVTAACVSPSWDHPLTWRSRPNPIIVVQRSSRCLRTSTPKEARSTPPSPSNPGTVPGSPARKAGVVTCPELGTSGTNRCRSLAIASWHYSRELGADQGAADDKRNAEHACR